MNSFPNSDVYDIPTNLFMVSCFIPLYPYDSGSKLLSKGMIWDSLDSLAGGCTAHAEQIVCLKLLG